MFCSNKSIFILLVGLVSVSVTRCNSQKITNKKSNLTLFVDPFIGTAAHGHTSPYATVPFGMVQLGPDTGNDGWDWCSGYNYSDSSIVGFSHTHLSGTGIGDMGDVMFMPGVGRVQITEGSKANPESGYRARFSHKDEVAKPGYYSVLLKDDNIKVELTATERAGFQKYTFPKTDSAHVIIDLFHGIGWDSPTDTYLKIENDSLITGYRRSKGWAENQVVFFAAKFSKPIIKTMLFAGDVLSSNAKEVKGQKAKGVLFFNTADHHELLVKVGISSVDVDGALKNLTTEIKGWNFEAVRKSANDKWEKQLQKISVQTPTDSLKTIFYTACFHSMLAPTIFSDVDGRYRGADRKTHTDKSFVNHSTFSLWDTYRANHPLFTITQPERTEDFVRSFLAFYKESGLLPVWPLANNETNCMIGYHAVPILADAYFKGLAKDVNWNDVFEAMKKSALQNKNGLKQLRELNYIPADQEVFSISKMLEYAIDDWCIAQMAKKLGKEDDYKTFSLREQSYKNVFDKQTGFFRAKLANGQWKGSGKGPFDPKYSDHEHGDYIEGNAWQYLWLVPQSADTLVNLLGGKEAFDQKLTKFFNEDSKVTGEHASNDISGMIGQYAHGNEPGHHTSYLYDFVDKPWKTQELTNRIMREMYNASPAGICGNEDCGQMSGWYVLSSMGIYPVNPADGKFYFGSPLFDQVTLNLENGKTFTIKARNVSGKNIYIKSIKLNGKVLPRLYINYAEIMNGGTLEFEMTDKI
ncbi:GH92 family glycosyl hydrolase [Solitalea koreensis]|uniref:Alpha-1,2-mannosidase, putative n=1 Tax=Solitalea koreensis TaxID=543615 RepID=A0A521E4A2_9SPHI|nr:GH92 family glycosyl hydrolase [Solitalea koreensis]SMO78682.1 alpha-1,2-mannosidase, putative [Solitalea koreensis]